MGNGCWRLVVGVVAGAAALVAVPIASGQMYFKQIAAPASEIASGRVALPDPAEHGVESPSAMLPIRFAVEGDRLVWRGVVPIDDGRDVRLMVLGLGEGVGDEAGDGGGDGAWRVRVASPGRGAMTLRGEVAADLVLADRGDVGLVGVDRDATRYRLLDRAAGVWEVVVEADVGDARVGDGADGLAGYLLVRTARPEVLHTTLTTYRLVVGERVGLATRMRDAAGGRVVGGGAIESARAEVVLPDGRTREFAMREADGARAFGFVAELAGRHVARVTVRGRHADGTAFVRTSQHVFVVLGERVELGARARLEADRDGTRLVRVPLDVAERDRRVIVSAEVWGRDGVGGEAAACWLSGMSVIERQKDGASVSLVLDERWLAASGVGGPFELRNVRVQCCDTSVPMDVVGVMPVDVVGGMPVLRRGVEVSADMLVGAPRADRMVEFAGGDALRRSRAFAGHNLMLVHGYCSSGVWRTADFSGGLEVFLDEGQNRSHDEFAQLMLAFGNGSKSFGVVAHSQGGAAALHLRTYYFSGLDWAEGARLIQSVGTPYQGTPLAGNLAVLGDLFGSGCGENFDLSTDGAALWLAGIPSAARADVSYWTTSFEDGFGFDFCNVVSDFFLSDPDDGVIVRSRGLLPGANNMGHVEGWCHTQGMRDPAQYFDTGRNNDMNTNGAR